jgi:hypothetical protein
VQGRATARPRHEDLVESQALQQILGSRFACPRITWLYGAVFGATPAPTPAMMDADVEKRDAGEEGFLHHTAPTFGVKPNKRLDAKAPLMEYERWNRDWARGSGDDPKGLAREYEGYIRDLDKDHGHDPGLIFARDLTHQVEKYHGTGSDLAKQFVTLLADRPDLQRQYLGGEVPKAPPIGTFKPGGLEGVRQWIDQDRAANGLAPRYAIPAVARGGEDVTVQRMSARGLPAPQAHNLFDFAQEMQGLPEDEAPAQQGAAREQEVEFRRDEPIQLAQATPSQPRPAATPGSNRRPLPPQAPLTRYDHAIGSEDRTPVPRLTTIGRNQTPTEDDQVRHEVFVRAARQLRGAGPRVQETLRHLWQTEGGDWIDQSETAASSGVTQGAYNRTVVAGGRVADLQGIRTPGHVPTDRRPEVMRDALDQLLARAGGSAALERFEDQTVANAIASTVYYVGPSDGGTAVREALKKTVGDSPPPAMADILQAGSVSKDLMDILVPTLADPTRRDAFLENLADARVPHLAKQLKKAPDALTEAELEAINRYRPSRMGR